jgi:signal transduction histidine kinase
VIPLSIRRSLRAKVALGFLVPLALLLGIFSAIQYLRHQEAHEAALTLLAGQTSQAIESSLHNEMLNRNLEGLQKTVDAIGQGDAIRALSVLDLAGQVTISADQDSVGQILDNSDPTCQPCHSLPASERPSSVIVELPTGERIFRSMNPVENLPECHDCHDPAQRLNGLLLIDISMGPLHDPLAIDLREHFLWPIATIAAVLISANFVIGRLVVRPLQNTARALGRFGAGSRDLQLRVDSPDEVGQLGQAFNSMAREVQVEEQKNQELAARLRDQAAARQQLLKRLMTAQEEERRRVARDLHDELGQDLAATAMQLEAIERTWPKGPQEALPALRKARSLLADATNRVYEVILSLRPSTLDDLGLAAAIRSHAERVLQGTGTRFEMDAEGMDRRLPPEIETAVFRSVQEALGNAVRHGQAKKISIALDIQEGFLLVRVTDDGVGFDVETVSSVPGAQEARGLGLLGMQERVGLWGGELHVESEPGHGTRLWIRIPLGGVSDGR